MGGGLGLSSRHQRVPSPDDQATAPLDDHRSQPMGQQIIRNAWLWGFDLLPALSVASATTM
jgi:hypothetical protein